MLTSSCGKSGYCGNDWYWDFKRTCIVVTGGSTFCRTFTAASTTQKKACAATTRRSPVFLSATSRASLKRASSLDNVLTSSPVFCERRGSRSPTFRSLRGKLKLVESIVAASDLFLDVMVEFVRRGKRKGKARGRRRGKPIQVQLQRQRAPACTQGSHDFRA